MSSVIGTKMGPLLASVLAASVASVIVIAGPARADYSSTARITVTDPLVVTPAEPMSVTVPSDPVWREDRRRYGQYEYDRGYEQGREDALRDMRARFPAGSLAITPPRALSADRDPWVDRHGMRMSERDLPRATIAAAPRHDPDWWEDRSRYGQHQFDRGYEKGREDARRWMREYSDEERMSAMRSHDAGDLFADRGRWEDRESIRMSERYVPPAPAVTAPTMDPWWHQDWNRIEANWPQARDSLLRRFDRLTAWDLDQAEGRRAAIVAAIQQRYNLSNERAHEQLVSWQQAYRG